MTRVRILAALVSIVSLLATSSTSAQDDRGRMHFQAGASYYEAGEYENALREFLRAHELSQRAPLFYNIAGCYQQLEDYANAATYLERYLNEVQDIPNRGNLERRLEHLRERAAAETSTDPMTTPQTTTTPPHTTTHPQVVPDELDPDGRPSGEADGPGGGPSGLRIGGFVGLGVGGAGVILATAFGVMALKERNTIADSACGMAGTCDPGDVERMDKLALASDLGLAIGIAGLATGIVLLIVGGHDDDEDAPSTGATAVSLEPWIGPSGVGASIAGRF